MCMRETTSSVPLCVSGFTLAEAMTDVPYTGLLKNKLKMQNFIQNCPESNFMLMGLKYCVASCLSASGGGNNWLNSLSFYRQL